MTALDEFYSSYLHYTVAQRLFEDTCRQLITFKGNVDERQAMVDETLRLAMCVTDNIDETEGLMADAIEQIQSEEVGDDLLEAMSLIANNLKEDRARANSYSNYVTYRRIGNRERKPRKPQVANPFIPVLEEEEPVEMVVIPPEADGSETEPEQEEGSIECDDAPVSVEPLQEDGDGESADAFDEEESGGTEEEEPSEEMSSEDLPEEESENAGGNPLVEESERILRREAPEEEDIEQDVQTEKKGILELLKKG